MQLYHPGPLSHSRATSPAMFPTDLARSVCCAVERRLSLCAVTQADPVFKCRLHFQCMGGLRQPYFHPQAAGIMKTASMRPGGCRPRFKQKYDLQLPGVR